ncbi:hypothetical protein [uncultured Planococcus sp.]|uniref:hypothetical protein n=1 Tax=uncultured Planococcus sp. TaxID=337815 RepID=UPI002638AD90|nr:hypothetical protein [uncultured Planococcus sp.]
MKLGITPLSIMNFFFMLGATVILAVQKDLFVSSDSKVYAFMGEVMPQGGYAMAAFATATILFMAFVLRNRFVEVVGLFLSGTFVLFVLCGYLLSFPNIASITYAVWTLATFMSIVEVLNAIQDDKDERAATIECERATRATQLDQLSRESTLQEERAAHDHHNEGGR